VRVSLDLVFESVFLMVRILNSADEGYKSGAYLAESVLGTDKSLLPFMRGMNAKEAWFEYLDKPENQGYMARMSSAFEGASKLEPITAIVQGERQIP
jgi:hypothetical protein